jgi:hypothetical protein
MEFCHSMDSFDGAKITYAFQHLWQWATSAISIAEHEERGV